MANEDGVHSALVSRVDGMIFSFFGIVCVIKF